MMKKSLVIILLLILSVGSVYASDKYEVAAVLSKEDVSSYAMCIDNYGSYHEVEYVLLPTKVDEGEYSVSLTRKETNLYQIDGTDLYIRTKYCYEYCYAQKAILVVHTGRYYSYGEVIFLD